MPSAYGGRDEKALHSGRRSIQVRGRKALKKKRRDASTTVSSSNPIKDANARLARELNEAREQQTATADVLKIISRSTFDLQAVLDTLVQSAAALCDATARAIYVRSGESFHAKAFVGESEEFIRYLRANPQRPGRGSVGARVLLTGKVQNIADVQLDENYEPAMKLTMKARAVLGVPLKRDDRIVGAIVLARSRPEAFNQRQIELAQTYADQAVIAIENARLLNELRQRTADLTERTTDLTEALEQQTATSEVLQVISNSPGDLQPVFATMLESAARICDAGFGNIFRWDGDALHLIATHNTPPAFAEARRSSPFRPDPNGPFGRMLQTKAVAHPADAAAEKAYTEQRQPGIVAGVELGGIRTILLVPMLNENELIGVFSLYRQEIRLFTDKQIALVQNFAAQAVIAIENTRLLNELRQRTTDLTEALEQQTATSAVLSVISSSPGNPERVFQAILENATRICEAKFGLLFLFDGSAFHLAAEVGTPPDFLKSMRERGLIKPPPGSHLDRVMRTKQVSHTADYAAEGIPSPPVTLGGARSTVDLPLLKDGQFLGAFSIYRQEVRPFTEKQIALLTNFFAAQAVIAIENARLLGELRQTTEEVVKLNRQLEQRVADQVGEIERMSMLAAESAVLLEPNSLYAQLSPESLTVGQSGETRKS
jgi:two-component system, NtrC family, sensor kinase